ncbi:hypothetical protein ODJ79_46725, partial [Actinoplanes sp. KI2]|nr:hypothetical protein [Actinoplanes sp. KI2]
QTVKGTQIANAAGAVAALPAGAGSAFDFKLTQVAGSTTLPNGTAIGAGLTVSVAALPAGSTPQDLASAINSAISTTLRQNGYQGNEISVTAKVDSQNNTTYSMSGVGKFTAADGTGAVLAGMKLGATAGTIALTDNAATNGSTGAFQVGANSSQKINIQIGAVDSQ